MMKRREKSINNNIYILAFLATVLCCVVLLIVAAMMPSGLVHINVCHSASMLNGEGTYIRFADYDASSQLDNWSESLILMESDLMRKDDMRTIFTNPLKSYSGNSTPTEVLYRYTQGETPEGTTSYNRYWMGFRGILRPLLSLLDLAQIRFYLAIAFFVMFAALIVSITKQVGSAAAMMFALSMIMVRPYVVGISLQFSCCFFIAFLAMMLAPWISEHEKYEGLFFMEIGMLTMYFDFYTTPIVTFGMPAIYIYLLYTKKRKEYSIWRVLKNASIWMGSYLAMWISKLLLTELFTSESAFKPAFAKAMLWLGAGSYRSENYEYSPVLSLKTVLNAVACDKISKMMLAFVFVALVVTVAIEMRRAHLESRVVRMHLPLWVIALLPIIWFAIAAEPTAVHFWFQYRSVAVIIWAVGGFVTLFFEKQREETKKSRFAS